MMLLLVLKRKIMTEVSEDQSYKLNTLKLQEKFLDGLRLDGKSANTLKNYKTDLGRFNEFLLKTKNKIDISTTQLPEILEYGKYLEEKYTSDNSRRRRVQTLRKFFDFLVEKQIFPTNPVRKIPSSPKFVDIPRPAHLLEIKTLWHHLIDKSKNENPLSQLMAIRDQLIMLLVYEAGLKISDIQKLKIEHIKGGVNLRVLITPLKRDPYTIPLSDVFLCIFKDYYHLLEKFKEKENLVFNEMFFNANSYKILSGGLSTRGIEKIFEEFRKKLILNITPKSLRQACIFKWIIEGQSDDQIKEWLAVAPSYSLKAYHENMENKYYESEFLLQYLEMY
jgi:integrase/recombinase XerC